MYGNSEPACIKKWIRRYGTGGIAELLCLKTLPGRQRAISAGVPEDLEKRLSEPEGFRSYNEIRTWLMDEYDPDIPYKTVHKTVRYYPGASPKAPRPPHIKKMRMKYADLKNRSLTDFPEHFRTA